MKRKKILVGAASLALIPGFFAVPVLAETAPVNDVIKWDSEYSVKLRQRSYGVQNTTIPTVTDLFNSISLKSYLSAADNFTGNDKAIYKVLHDKFKEVTEGKITDTVFYISVDELKAAGWTVPNTSAYNNRALLALQKENHDTFWKNMNSIIVGLLSDDPLNTAWYDKTVGLATANKEETEARAKASNFNDYDSGWGYMYFSEKPKESKVVFNGFWVKFGVINEARDKSASEPTYTVKKDSDGMTRIQKALAKAKEIVAEAASMSDIEKIKYYNKKISEMTDYDYDYYGKSVSGQEAPYGGQSMFFNVFDGDESTKVVCEGYSKAFKLLCDLTTWQGKVECNIVTGTMAGGTGAGLHMWNIVTYNGANYLVDTTNSDEGTIGAPDKLILATLMTKIL